MPWHLMGWSLWQYLEKKQTGCHKEEYLVNDTSIAKLDMVYFGKVKLVLMFLKDVNHYWVGIFLHLPVRVSVAPVKAVVSGFETTPPSLEGSGNSSAGGIPGLVLDHITPLHTHLHTATTTKKSTTTING